jgi:hypothetical protein
MEEPHEAAQSGEGLDGQMMRPRAPACLPTTRGALPRPQGALIRVMPPRVST